MIFFFIQNISEGELFLKDMNSYYAVHRKGNKEFVSEELFSIRFENMYRIKMAIKEIVCISSNCPISWPLKTPFHLFFSNCTPCQKLRGRRLGKSFMKKILFFRYYLFNFHMYCLLKIVGAVCVRFIG